MTERDKTNPSSARVQRASKSVNELRVEEILAKHGDDLTETVHAKPGDEAVAEEIQRDREALERNLEGTRLREGLTGKPRDAAPGRRMWRSEVPSNPNDLLLTNANKPDVVES